MFIDPQISREIIDQDDSVILNSPACQPKPRNNRTISRIYFSHTRKAGGSTLRHVLSKIERKFHLEMAIHEGSRTFNGTKDPSQDEVIGSRSDTLYLTSIRDPVARALSHYKYEGRWDCRGIVERTFTPTANNSQPLVDFVNETPQPGKIRGMACNATRRTHQNKIRNSTLWECGQSCYLRWFGSPFNCVENVTASFQTALKKLLAYDIIVVTEWLENPDYLLQLEKYLGAPSYYRGSKRMYCGRESKYWNSVFPAELTPGMMRGIQQANLLDTHLYGRLVGPCGGNSSHVTFPKP